MATAVPAGKPSARMESTTGSTASTWMTPSKSRNNAVSALMAKPARSVHVDAETLAWLG